MKNFIFHLFTSREQPTKGFWKGKKTSKAAVSFVLFYCFTKTPIVVFTIFLIPTCLTLKKFLISFPFLNLNIILALSFCDYVTVIWVKEPNHWYILKSLNNYSVQSVRFHFTALTLTLTHLHGIPIFHSAFSDLPFIY